MYLFRPSKPPICTPSSLPEVDSTAHNIDESRVSYKLDNLSIGNWYSVFVVFHIQIMGNEMFSKISY